MLNVFKNNKIKFFYTIAITTFMVFLCYIRLKISENISVDFDFCNRDMYDRAFYIQSAIDFKELTVNSFHPLIKNRGYIWLLILSHFLGITPHILSTIFWILSALLGYIITKRMSKSYAISIGVFSYILFNPIAFANIGGSWERNEIYRNIMYVQFAFLYIELFLILFFEIKKKVDKNSNFILSILCGIVFSINYFLSETGTVHVLVLLGFSILFFFYFAFRTIFKKEKHKLFSCAILIFLPLLVFSISVIGYKLVNYRSYGVYATNFRTDDEVGKFISYVQDIESDKQDAHYWCTDDQLRKAYDVSDTLKNNEDFYNVLIRCYGSGFIPNIGYNGDFLGWGITTTLKELKIPYDDANEMFKHINTELENAYKYGTLTKTKKFKLTKTVGRYTKEEVYEIIDLTKQIAIELFTLKNIYPFMIPYGKSIDKTKRFVTFFNLNANPKNVNSESLLFSIIHHYVGFNQLLLKSAIVIVILLILFNVVYLFLCINNTKYKYNIFANYNVYFVLSICFFAFYFLYIFAVANVLIWLKIARDNIISLYYFYCGVSIAFLSFAFLFIFSSFSCLYKKIISLFNANSLMSFTLLEFFMLPFAIFGPAQYVHEYFKTVPSDMTANYDFNNNIIKSSDIVDRYLDYKQIDDLFDGTLATKSNIKPIDITNNNLVDNISIIELSDDKYLLNYFTKNFKYKKHLKNHIELNKIKDCFDNAKDILLIRIDRKFVINKMTPAEFKEILENLFNAAILNGKTIFILPIGQNITCMKQIIEDDSIDNYYNYVIKKCTSIYNNVTYIDIENIYKKYIITNDNSRYSNYNSDIVTKILKSISTTLNLN